MADSAKKILIVEDEQEILENIAEYLSASAGEVEVLTAASAEAALDVLAETDIFLVVSDIKMPGMSGLDLLSKIRSEYSHIGVILMTGYKTEKMFQEAEKSGALHFLEKPFQLAHLKKLILRQIEKQKEGFAGTLKNIQMTDLIQMCCLSMLSMTLRVTKGDKEGAIYIQDGQIVHAQCDDVVGERAFYLINSWENGQFETLGEMPVPEVSISSPWESLLMEAVRQADESKAQGDLDAAFSEEGDAEDDGAVVGTRNETAGAPGDAVYRVLVVDDSAMMCKALKRILEKDARIEHIQTAKNGEEALKLMDQEVFDLITLDVNMPVMDGSTALKHIMLKNPCPVLIVSSLSDRSHDAILDFLCLGAVDFIGKPTGGQNLEAMEQEFIDKAIAAAGAKVGNFKRIRVPKITPDAEANPPTDGPCKSLIVIRSGIGGYAELNKLLPFLPGRAKGALLLIQDMPTGFESTFSAFLDKRCRMTVRTLDPDQPLQRGACYVVSSQRCPVLTDRDGELAVRISAVGEMSASDDRPHLMSEDATIPSDALMVMLSGVSRISQDELQRFRDAGGRVVVQEPSSCMVPQPLQKLVDDGRVDAAMQPDAIVGEITRYLDGH